MPLQPFNLSAAYIPLFAGILSAAVDRFFVSCAALCRVFSFGGCYHGFGRFRASEAERAQVCCICPLFVLILSLSAGDPLDGFGILYKCELSAVVHYADYIFFY